MEEDHIEQATAAPGEKRDLRLSRVTDAVTKKHDSLRDPNGDPPLVSEKVFAALVVAALDAYFDVEQ